MYFGQKYHNFDPFCVIDWSKEKPYNISPNLNILKYNWNENKIRTKTTRYQ